MDVDFAASASAACSVVLGAAAVLVALRAAQCRTHERVVWRWTAVAVAILAVGSLACSALTLAGHPAPGHFIHVVTLLGLSAAAYQAVIWWNRVSTRASSPGDWLNGISAAFAGAAVMQILVHPVSFVAHQPASWLTQAGFLSVAAVVVVLGALPPIAVIGGLSQDIRFWLVSGGLTAVLVASASQVVMGRGESGLDVLCAFGALLVSSAAGRTPRAGLQTRAATTQAATVGTLVVLGAAVLVLAAATQLDHARGQAAVVLSLLAIAGVSTRVLTIIRDLAHLATSRQEALTDELTGVANRRALLRELSRYDTAVTMLLLDVDRFKDVNDRLGHVVGDDLLITLAGRIGGELGKNGLLARVGGDEFAVVLTGGSVEAHMHTARRMAAAAAAPIDSGGRRLQVTVSIGAVTSDEGLTTSEMLRRADTAMYLAKHSGSGLAVYDAVVDAHYTRRMLLLEQLRLVQSGDRDEAGELVAYYQPQIDVGSGRVAGAEALVRWQHPQLGVIPPAEFLSIVEEHGMMDLITTTILSQAVRDAVRWQARGNHLQISVNVSTSCLSNPELVPFVRHTLATHALNPSHLTLEVTETDAIRNPDAASTALQALIELGVNLSIDDYGTGYSSLAYLRTLPVKEVKLDRSFTADLLRDPRTAHIVASTLELAHRLGLEVVAEGVEDGATLDALADLGCERSQGFLHARPMPAHDFDQWLEQRPATDSRGFASTPVRGELLPVGAAAADRRRPTDPATALT